MVIIIIAIYKVHDISKAKCEASAVTRWVEVGLRAIRE